MKGQDPYLIRDFVEDFDSISEEFADVAARSRAGECGRTCLMASGRAKRWTFCFPTTSPRAPLHVFARRLLAIGREGTVPARRGNAALGGRVTAMVEYDLMPGQRLATLVAQVRRALIWLQENAASFGADPNRISVSGHSAGAHLSSYLAATGTGETHPKLPQIKAMLLLSGIYDLKDIPDSFLRNEAAMTHEEAALWSPLSSTQLPGPHRIIAFGGDETPPFLEQAAALEGKLRAPARARTAQRRRGTT